MTDKIQEFMKVQVIKVDGKNDKSEDRKTKVIKRKLMY